MDLNDRVNVAQANLEATIKDQGYDWTVRVSRVAEGYRVVFENGSCKVIPPYVEEGTLEDTVSEARTRLVRSAASDLEGQP
jgi:hypothetical protein